MALLGLLQECLSTEVQENAPLETLLLVPPHWEELALFLSLALSFKAHLGIYILRACPGQSAGQ